MTSDEQIDAALAVLMNAFPGHRIDIVPTIERPFDPDNPIGFDNERLHNVDPVDCWCGGMHE